MSDLPTNEVRRVRQERGMRPQDLADAAGVSRPCVVRIENGRRAGHWTTQRAIAQALDTPARELFPL